MGRRQNIAGRRLNFELPQRLLLINMFIQVGFFQANILPAINKGPVKS